MQLRVCEGSLGVGWSLTSLSAQKGYIVPYRNYSLLKSFISLRNILLRGIAENVRELRMLIIFFSNLFFVYIAFG